MVQIVIAGGGYAGLSAARTLARALPAPHRITLIDRDAHHELTVRLPSVLSGRVGPSDVRVPYEQVLPRTVRFVQDTVTRVDPAARLVTVSNQTFAADYLLLALGRIPDYDAIPGGQHARVLKSVADALRIRDDVRALLGAGGPARVVLIGAGYTSTEVAGELLVLARSLRNATPLHVTVAADEQRLLPLGNARLAAMATRMLRERGIAFRLGTDITGVTADHVRFADGQTVEYDVAIWGGPSRGGPESTGEAGGRLLVDPYLRVTGYDRVYAIGDLAATYDYVRDLPVAASAQFAVQEGRLAAQNVVDAVRGDRPAEYRPFDLGEALDMGAAGAAAEVAGRIVTGAAARAVKRAALARYLLLLGGPTLVRRYL